MRPAQIAREIAMFRQCKQVYVAASMRPAQIAREIVTQVFDPDRIVLLQ